MPVKHVIDEEQHLLVTTWNGEASDSALMQALVDYQHKFKMGEAYRTYNELVDFRDISDIRVTNEGLKKIGMVGPKTDQPNVRTKLAFVVGSPLAFGLACMYEAYRKFVPGSNKEVQVFRNISEAYDWLGAEPPEQPD